MTLFERFDGSDVRKLVEDYPLAWVCGGGAAAMEASLLPLVGRFDEDGALVELIGHLARSNPLRAALTADPRATILFRGPDSYVSPDHAGVRDWAPTWNYAQLKVRAEVRFDEALTEYALETLVEAMEKGRPRPWSIAELGDRYHAMLGGIVGFRAIVTGLTGKFKLGQDERAETRVSIIGSLPDPDTVAWMRRFDRGRS
ncbi:FMN-binding negative transcriptional regulator [Sphingopyxis sp.]|uniref:FMN-binding negative transcriptional regulator n=1 Tax=Sphingopyxis sp. TaxID=1908224 RepID=UPI0026125E16|nr:FMN-binding negative transcriptional regulator [Sphingopyxis sp.]MCW0197774.1 FMN-binding negative transcriptional regulator [Sphingopyxis sp.]